LDREKLANHMRRRIHASEKRAQELMVGQVGSRREKREEGERNQQFCVQEHHAQARADGTVSLHPASHSSHPVKGRKGERTRGYGQRGKQGRGKAGSERDLVSAVSKET